MKTITTLLFLWLSLIGFGQASTVDTFNLTIKFDMGINIDSIHIFFYETPGQKFNSINYSTDKSNNSITIFGSNDYVIGTKFPTLVFSYRTLESKDYLYTNSLNKNNHFRGKETIETIQLFYLIAGHGVGSYKEHIPAEIKFTLEKNTLMITKEWLPNATVNGGVQAKYNINSASTDELSHGHRFKEALSISNKLTKINKR
jgi:hypothetical protein